VDREVHATADQEVGATVESITTLSNRKEKMIDRSQRSAALVFAITFPLTNVMMMFSFTQFLAPILIWNQDAATAQNLIAHAHNYHLFMAASCLHGLAGVVLLAALYLLLKPVHRGVALFAALSRLVFVAMWFQQVIGEFTALRIMGGEGSLQVFDAKQLQALAGLQLASGWDAYYIGLPFYALSTLLFSWLFFQSRIVPRILAALGMLASLFELVCGFAYLNNRGFGALVSVNYYELPNLLFELALSIWLIVSVIKSQRWKNQTSQAA